MKTVRNRITLPPAQKVSRCDLPHAGRESRKIAFESECESEGRSQRERRKVRALSPQLPPHRAAGEVRSQRRSSSKVLATPSRSRLATRARDGRGRTALGPREIHFTGNRVYL
jgi:hypothetical protein